MSVKSKFKMECPNCGCTGWIPSKTTADMDDDGNYYTLRYRICKECGHKIRTIQYKGFDEILFTGTLRAYKKRGMITVYDNNTGEKVHTESWSLEDSMRVLTEVYGKEDKPKLVFNLRLKGE